MNGASPPVVRQPIHRLPERAGGQLGWLARLRERCCAGDDRRNEVGNAVGFGIFVNASGLREGWKGLPGFPQPRRRGRKGFPIASRCLQCRRKAFPRVVQWLHGLQGEIPRSRQPMLTGENGVPSPRLRRQWSKSAFFSELQGPLVQRFARNCE